MALAELHATAVDYGKNGIDPYTKKVQFAKTFPDFMGREDDENTYESENILGRLYRETKSLIENSDIKKVYKNGKESLS